MAYLIKNATVFAPAHLGVKDILIINDKIVLIDENINVSGIPNVKTIDVNKKIVTPGFIDQHIHVTGGGGEGGPRTRPPEIMLSELVACGTTSLVGVCGTDSVSRSIENLLAKVRALTVEGVSAWMYTSNYSFPPTTLCGSVKKDLYFVPELLGVKIALGDHRSSFPNMQEVLHLLADVRIGGMIAGKIGVLHVHTGDLKGAFEMYDEIIALGMPIRHIRPTHCSRSAYVFDMALKFANKGGHIDLTSGDTYLGCTADNVEAAWNAGINPELITLSSDGHGSFPKFNEKGEMIGIRAAAVDTNLNEIKTLISRGHSPEKVLPIMTSNVANGLALKGKGELYNGSSGDLCVFDQDWNITDVFSKGVQMMRDKQIIVKGTFED